MSNAIRSLLKGKKKSEKNLKQRIGDAPTSGGHSAPASKTPGSSPAKSIDDQSYKQWVHDHDNEDEQYIDEEGEEAIVLYNYTPNPSSEENDEIALEKDEIIIVYEQHVSGWWTGQSTKHGYGLFPGAFVRLLSQKAPPAGAAAPSATTPPTPATPATPAAPAAATAPASTAVGTPAPVPKPEKPAGLSHHLASVKDATSTEATTPSSEPAQKASEPNRLSQSCDASGPAPTSSPVDDEPAPVKKSFSHIARVPSKSPDRADSSSSVASSSGPSDSCSDSLFLKTVLDQLYAKLSALQSRVPLLEAKIQGGAPGDAAESLRKENAELQKQLEEMRIEKEVHGWRQDKELTELRKEVARLTELTQLSGSGRSDDDHLQAEITRLKGELAAEKQSNNGLLDEVAKSKKEALEQVSVLRQELAKESSARERERAESAGQNESLRRTQQQLRDELDSLRAQQKSSSAAASPAALPSAMPADFMDHIKSYMEQHTAQMQAELQHLKSEVATKEVRPDLEHEVAQLRQALESEQRERAKLRQDLINQMTSSQINRIKAEVLQRAEVKEGKLWDPVNNVFLAADGKWLRPTGIDLSE